VQGWDLAGNPVATITFMRAAFNAQGQKVKTPVASCNLFNPVAAQTPVVIVPVAAQPATPGVIILPKTITLKSQPTP
jgi:hypothetical protein